MSNRILVADDTAYMRAVIRETLASVGMIIVGEAQNGSLAISMYKQLQPDLTILNIIMPQMDGMEALKEIKTWDPNAKVLICSAMGQAPTIFSAIRLGASDFLIKPFDSRRLIEVVSRVLNLKLTHPG